MIESVFITGANAGLGKEAARQLAEKPGIKKIYLGCRNPRKAQDAKKELEQATGKRIFEILTIDVSDLKSVRRAAETLPASVDALIMNAGGTGGQGFNQLNSDGVTRIFAVNLLGHAVLTEELLKANKLKQVALYAGSEAARGVEEMGMKRPALKSSSIEEFVSIGNGSFYGPTKDATTPYGPIKYMAALWMSAMARQHTQIRFVTMSPGATTGTEGFNTLPPLKRYVMKGMMQVMLMLGKVHKVETGAQRYLDGLFNPRYKSGAFYASKKGLTGPVGEQGKIFSDINNETYQDNAYMAIQRFLK
ncbi:SDR family NAD(P)-dependent oxidoreductase [Pseudoteredinibacter isoporae]|uniref:NAD(P)-dependent dehydrogenase (Short-subunit alcohol dehydrogenase family) n=1 Tax=Pseudoteredinibacter isoporae TaxID=570281 RepID=A0A7X0MXW4_9GAMM|nr:SDR family NAD(P)-dependent oxidoreductase [Pseudoteredinibacter isoporae]MBB6522424.1 NAD(P)-dependent dehydrogenase (short-subunit alcohol dehydrogenase family) [Pseudoteredinibacter isoporae]NHO87955.1 SDR family NAD(P)-dependent oxidoreductase [Pseudoteredinibacter isoporae]NIB23714.1 SDR family NAD(P)-dependent oxidoreductase [Pseudoteredinibacter isoporae]